MQDRDQVDAVDAIAYPISRWRGSWDPVFGSNWGYGRRTPVMV